MKQLLYLLFFCSCAVQAQEQKYILLDSITSNYTVKKYTLSTLPYKVDYEIEIYNVFSKNYGKDLDSDFIVLFSVLPDLETKSNWEEIDFKKVQNNLFSAKKLFEGLENKMLGYNIISEKEIKPIPNNLKLVKKVKNTYYVSKECMAEPFYCIDSPEQMIIATGNYIINTHQPIVPITLLKEVYQKKVNTKFPLDWNEYPPIEIPKHQEHIYLANIEEKEGNTIYYFYQFANVFDRGIYEFAYIKNKGIVAGTYDDYFFPKGKVYYRGGDWLKVRRPYKEELLWAEELKKEWAEKEKAKK
ncbi:hypothetical protein [Capnocytophaga sputigena]|uniref:YARHG domain-containing protein n=1 Tax=Capnocytophaga sputigena TaxID=1019 RepID=A0AAX2IBG0_CAPSP|nr:hypothetical protein [Capnocytophaga sputigena]ATA84631.1 hypothetical protein CGC55_09000 [Capnocytophaga sputigena]EEB66700.1 hypothetical protein CAPSP0001_1181 [Capnocytophaga sputigena ATCC 33612]SQA75588.1 Uncharacterised protein [Capnocytophaga sputigena]